MTTRAFTMFFDNCLSGVGDSLNEFESQGYKTFQRIEL